MTTTRRTSQNAAAPVTTLIPTPKRFLRCIACGTTKKERSYALCAECYRLGGTLSSGWFRCWMRHAEREGAQYSFRNDPRFEKACRVYARRQRRAEATAAVDALLPPARRRRETDPRNRHEHDGYDGLGAYDLADLLEWQMHDVALPAMEGSAHREMTDAEIARWDARVDAWVEAHGLSLREEPAAEIQPWGYYVEVDGARVWTDVVVLD